MHRRRFLTTTAAAIGGAGILRLTAGCASTATATPTTVQTPSRSPVPASKTLLAYFSRAGENYYNGGRRNLTVGNTEVVANLITGLLDTDVYRIEAADPYPDGYDQTVARNVAEQVSNARPAIAKPLPDVAGYGTILLGSPIWNLQPPMIMRTFTEQLNLQGKTIHPFTTHAMSGLGRAEDVYTNSCPGAVIGEGLAIRGEEAGQAEPDIRAWLRRAGILT